MKEKNSYTKRILLMLIPCVLISLSDFIAWPVFLAAVIEIAIMPYAFPILLILNIACFLKVENDKTAEAFALARSGGFIGGFIATNTVNKNFAERWRMNYVFIIMLFIFVIYPLWAYALFEFEIHGMLM